MIIKSIIFALIMLGMSYLNCAPKNSDPEINKIGDIAAEIGAEMYDQNANNAQIDLRVGQNIMVRLPTNPSTGYRWEIVENSEDILSLLGRDYQQLEAAPGMVGVGGVEIFKFKAIKKGNLRLALRYARVMPSPAQNWR